jgi:hypothetical protein
MAVTQPTAGDLAAFGNVTQADAGGYYYITFGSVWLFQGAGSPNAILTTAPRGSLYVDTTAAKLYICTVNTGTWVVVGSLS